MPVSCRLWGKSLLGISRSVLEQSGPRHLSLSLQDRKSVKNVTIVGGGLMGSGIAQVCAVAGQNVVLVDVSSDVLAKSKKSIETSLVRVAKKKFPDDSAGQKVFVSDVLGNVGTENEISKGVKEADLVVEAVPENLELKRKLFAQIEQHSHDDTIMASNTSSLALEDIGRDLKRQEKFGGVHFFNPVPLMKLLEIIRHKNSSDETWHSLEAWGQSIGKTTVACKDAPGFIVNRMLVPYLIEALQMAERGDATTEDIDVAMKLGAGYPMGPFELCDYVGLDTLKFIIDGWHEHYPELVEFQPNAMLNKLVKDGRLGRKSGEGFYKYK